MCRKKWSFSHLEELELCSKLCKSRQQNKSACSIINTGPLNPLLRLHSVRNWIFFFHRLFLSFIITFFILNLFNWLTSYFDLRFLIFIPAETERAFSTWRSFRFVIRLVAAVFSKKRACSIVDTSSLNTFSTLDL